MTGTPGAFRGAVRRAFGDAVVDDATGVEVALDGVRIRFTLRTLPPQRHGALQLECFEAEIAVLAGDAGHAATVLARIDRATQRGGG